MCRHHESNYYSHHAWTGQKLYLVLHKGQGKPDEHMGSIIGYDLLYIILIFKQGLLNSLYLIY